MDINCICPAFKCNIMEFLPYFLDVDDNYEDIKISPSRLLHELQMPTEERIERLCRPTKRKKLASRNNCFSAVPDIMIFQNFQAGHIYKAKLTLQNLQPVSRHLSIIKNSTPYFEVVYSDESSSVKVAPGMTFSVNVVFKPVEFRDHLFSVKFMTDGETFSVPVHGLGQRPFLSIADHISLRPTAVRVPSQKSIVLHNFGHSQTCFVASCQEPCKVSPVRGSLKPNQITELIITCMPTNSRPISTELYFTYEDIKLVIPVTCEVVKANVYLETSSVIFDETYMGLQSHRKLTAYNCSPFMLEFKWKTCKSDAMEELERSKLVKSMNDLAGLEKKKSAKLEYMNIIDAEGHSAILDQGLAQEITEMEKQFLFGNSIYSVLPVVGRILPNQCLEFTIIFSPQKSDYYTGFAYLDVTGIEERIPVCLSGGGRGPQVVFNAKTLNAQDIFLDGTHDYQLVAKNDGNIPALVSFVENDTEFGGVIKCMPKRHYIPNRDICKSFIVSFRSKFQGQFVEKIQFMIEESKELVDVLFVGNVVCPLLKPDIQDLDFGEVSFGSQPTKEFVLTNDSQVPIDFRLYVPSNEEENEEEIDLEEFEFFPQQGVVEAFSSSVIKVTLTTLALQDIKETLMVSMWGSQRYSIELPLRYNCVCPTILCIPQEVFISFCFLNYEYKRTITLRNCSSVDGGITYTPTENPIGITCTLNKTEFLIFANEEIEIELTIQTDSLGTHEFPLIFTVAGSNPESICTVRCNGQGPVVSFSPEELHFGNITLLNDVTKTLTLINDSPIQANITVSTPSSSNFMSNMSRLVIAPEDKQELIVIGYLTDTGKVNENLNLEIENGETVAIPIVGEGVGSSILCEPNIDPEYDAGILLTHQVFKMKVKLTNLGKKRYKIAWTRRQGVKNLKELDQEDGRLTVFRIEPNRFELGLNESQQIELIGSSKKVQVVREDFYCLALIDKSSKIIQIMSCSIKAEFVEPNVQFSDWTLNFLCAAEDYHMYFKKSQPSSMMPMIDYQEFYRPPVETTELLITNDTDLPLKVFMKTTSDYFINHDGERTTEIDYELEKGNNYNAKIEFRPKVQSKRYSKKHGRFTVDFSRHPKEDTIDLIGEIMYPTVKLVPDRYDFECLPLDSYTCTNILIQNITIMPVNYSWELLEDDFEIENLEILSEYDKCKRTSLKSIESDDGEETISVTVSQAQLEMSDIEKIGSKHRNNKQMHKKLVSMAEIPSKIIKQRGLGERSKSSIINKESSVDNPDKLPKDVEQIGSNEEIHVDWDYNTYYMEATKCLKNIATNHLVEEDEEFLCEIKNGAPSAYSIGNIVTIEPSNGILAPFEYGAINIGFFPPPNVKVKCTAICRIEGGEEERFLITGMSSKISYKFDKQVIEFGRKLFSEILESTLLLTNDGYSKFHFKELADKGRVCLLNIPPGWLCVNPSEGCLLAGESITLSIKYFPGKTGEFRQAISFEIGYLEPHEVEIHGYASFSQLSLTIPRLNDLNNRNDLSYRAISSITEEYLLSFKDVKSNNISKYEHRHGCPDKMSEASYKSLLHNDWVVISENDIYPTETEIDLSKERILLNEYLQSRNFVSTQSVARKVDTFSEFTVPPYIVDFGYVIINKPVCYTVLVLCCGPVDTEVKLEEVNRNRLEGNELKIEFRAKRMCVGDMTELYVIFSPSRKRCGPHKKRIEECIILTSKNGGKIPILIRATATTPTIKIDHSCIEFGSVKIGNALRKSVIIRNDGNLLSKWTTEVQSLNKQIDNAYHIIPNNGELLPGEKNLLNIYWVPINKGANDSELTIRVERNSINTSLELYGLAIEPILAFSELKLEFDASLPYSEKIEKFLIVQNASTFPVEYCFPDYDQDYAEEKQYIELYLRYHNYDSVLIPERLPGYKLHEIFQANYYFLMNQIKEKLLSTETCSGVDGSFDLNAKYGTDEIFRLMIEHIESMPGDLDDSNTDVCPLDDEYNSRMAIIDPLKRSSNESLDQRRGVIIIFHGGPKTNYYKAANRAGIVLSMQVYSIDRLITEELVENQVGPAAEIKNIIETSLQGYKFDHDKLPEEDDYDFLWRKITTLLNKKPKSSSGKLPTSAAKNKGSGKGSDKKSETTKTITNNVTLVDMSTELLIDLLRKRFDNTKTGIVIESLNSEFLRKPNVALDSLLHAIGSIRYIHIIMLSYTLEDYIENETTRLINEDKIKYIRSREGIDNDDLSNLDAGKRSVKSKMKREPSKNYLKQVTKDLPKDLKIQFELFRELLEEILHVCEFWERRCQVLTRPFSRNNLGSKKDTKSSAKDSALDSRSSNRKSRKMLASSIAITESVGISLWAISNCNDDRITDLEIVPTMLKCNPDLNDAILELEGTVHRIEESNTTFSVIRQMKKYTKCPNNYFKICQSIIGKQETTVHLTTSSVGGNLRKKASKRKASSNSKDVRSASSSGFRDSSDTLRTRFILSPGDKTTYQISFSPPSIGKYNYNYLIDLVGIDRPYMIQCNALCQLPQIDCNPAIMFPKCQDAYRNKILGDNFVYYKEEDVFDFGYIFVGNHKTQPYATKIIFKNTTELPCEITAQLAENSHFAIGQENLSVEPQGYEELSMTLKAAKKGKMQSELFITIKYNPSVKIIRLAAQACPVEFTIHPKAISFEKVPLNYSDKRKITLTNPSPVNLVWKFVKAEWASDIYNISKTSGAIKLYSVDEIIVEFLPTQEEINPKKSFEIQVFDLNHSDIIPVFKDDISIVSESVEYQVEFKTHIEMGDVKGKSQTRIPFHMSNNGKSNVTVLFSELNNILPEEMHIIRKFFKINFKTEVLPAQKSTAIMIIFNPTTELNFENIPVYNCSFVENNNPENVISSFIITFSGVVHLSRYELCPASDLYFGYQQVGTATSQKMEIKNTGKFPFQYAILSFEDTMLSIQKKQKTNEQTSKSNMDVFKKVGSVRSRTASPKGKDKSKEKAPKASKLEVPGFTIQSSTRTVLPNEIVQIEVECLPKQLEEYERVLVIFVTECQKEDLYGRKITLHVEGTEPRCNFDDYEKMFREQFVVRELGDFICPENIGSYSVFVVAETALYLKNICVNENYTMKIYLQNLGQVIAEAVIKLEDKNNFTVSPSTLFIPPYETESIFITFTPDSINKFMTKLSISYNSSVSDIFVLSLYAESCVPQISLVEPTPDADKVRRIDFIPTYIEMTQSRKICVENIGSIPCKLIMDLCNDKHNVFNLVPQNDQNMLNMVEEEDIDDNPPTSLMVNLLPKKRGYFDLVFKPSYEKFFKIQLKIHTVNNPFEIITIHITGQSYHRDIYVDGLETLNLNKCAASTPYIGYILDFGFSSLNKLLKKCFTLNNNSKDSIYKFEFTHDSSLMVIPRVGHLKPNTSKEIIAVISTKYPLCLQKVKIECNFMIIRYVDSDISISWDDRQQMVDWDHPKQTEDVFATQYFKEAINIAMRELYRSVPDFEENTKCILNRSEPEHILSTNVWDVLPIFLSVTADYAKYECAVKELIFSDTFVKEKNEIKFFVVNSGLVPINIEWYLSCDEILPQRSSSADIRQSSDSLMLPAPSLISSLSSTTLFSSTDSKTGTDVLPLEILPRTTVIEPNETTTFSLVFAPLVSSQYYLRLTSNISSLDPSLKNIDITVIAESLVPECYLEIEDTDYFTRRPPLNKCIDERDDFKVVELTSVGIGVTSTRIFNVVNASKDILSFNIELLNTENEFSYFNCKTPTGMIRPGKKTEAAFCFIPQEIGSFEEYYKFSIESINFHRFILLAGLCRDPRVYFLKAHITVKPTLLGVPSEEMVTLKNEEYTELDFKFLKHSFYNQEHDQRFKVVPMSGTVNPQAEYDIKLVYNAEKIGEANFYLKCAVEKMKSNLNLTVTATCMEVLCSVSYTNKNGVIVHLDSDRENIIDLGHIGIKLKRVTKVLIKNTGQTGFFYGWKLNKKALESSMIIMVDSEKEFVSAGSCATSDIIVESFRPYVLKDFKMKLEITYGPTYVFKLNAVANEPMCKFSFMSYDFGCCIVQKSSFKYNEVLLKAKNLENNPIMIQNQFENNKNLTIDFKSSQVLSYSSGTIPICFHPQAPGKYEINVPLIVKSMKKIIKVEGEGVKLNLQLMNPSDKFINLEPVKLGSKRRYKFEVLNRTPTKVNVILFFSADSPIHEVEDTAIEPEMVAPKEKVLPKELSKIGKKKVATEVHAKNASQEKKIERTKTESQLKVNDVENGPVRPSLNKSYIRYLMIHPKECVAIESNKKHEYIIEFNPKERIEKFSEKIFYKVQDYIEPLCVVRGSCKAPEFALDKDILTFSNIIMSCSDTRNVLLMNTGDTPGKFRWSFEEPMQVYKIYPIEGIISPHSEIKMSFTFKPNAVYCQLIKKAKCTINKTIILELKIIGNSLNLPHPVDTVKFSCPVRETTTAIINVPNNSLMPWTLYPILSKDTFWMPSGGIKIEPGTNLSLEIQYRPQYMTKLKPEQATLFLPLPEGQAIIYELIGTSLPPLSVDKMFIELRCKENHTENLIIKNWQDTMQCFEVKTELMSNATPKTIYKTFGHKLIEVPPNKTWEYKWNVYVMNEEQLEMKVIFMNTATGEYLFYEISLKVLPSDPLETIKLSTCLREQVKTTIKLKNPINLPVTFNITGSTELQFEKTVSMKPYTVRNLDICYCPLKCEDIKTNLEVSCEELGTFMYVIELLAKSPSPERVLKFKAELGDKVFNTISVKNTFSMPFEISAKFDHPVFSADKVASTPVGEVGKIIVKFEPSQLGILESRAVLSSSVTGDYIYPLIGECIHPTPKGPFSMKPGGSVSILFENPFIEQKTFEFVIDSSKFLLKSTSEDIKPRKSTKIVVSLPARGLDGNVHKYPLTAKLVAHCTDPDLNFIQWVFYIQSDQ